MQTIKIPFSIKFYLFFALMWIFLSLLGINYWYWYYWINYFFVWAISLLLSIIQVTLLFKYFKDPKKYSNTNIFFIIFMLLLYIWIAMYKWFFLIIIIIYHLIFLFKFIQFKKFLNLEKWEKKDKYIKYTDKNQFKNILILYWIIIISLIIFYITQYSKVINFKHIDDDYFNIPEQYLNISEEENWLKDLKKYSEHINSLNFIEDKNFRNKDYIKKIILDTWITFKFDTDRVNSIDNLRLWIDKIINKKVIIENFDEVFPSIQWFSMMTRETLYNTLYHLENWEEEKAVKYLIDNYKLSKLMISSYWPIPNFIVWITINDITLSDLKFIMDNYKLKNTTLLYIKNNFENSIDIKSSYKATINYEYNSIKNILSQNWEYQFINAINNSLFFDKNYLHEWLKNAYYWVLQMDWNYNTNWDIEYPIFDWLDEYICSKKNIDKLRWELIIPKLFFKKNTISNILITQSCIINRIQHKLELENIMTKEKMLLEKIDNLLNNK